MTICRHIVQNYDRKTLVSFNLGWESACAVIQKGSSMIPSLMIVDDNAIDQKLYTRLIERSGLVGELHCFLMASDAINFLASPDRPAIDIVLLDINMPRMNGFEFLDHAVERFGPNFVQAAVIMLTTSMSDPDRKRAFTYEVVRNYIQKPLQLSHLQGMSQMSREGAL